MINEGAAWAIFFLPMASFVLISFFIRPFFNQYDRYSGYLTILAIGAAFGLSLWALIGLAVLLGAAVFLRLGRRSLREAA